MAEVEVTDTEGQRWVVDRTHLRLPDDLRADEEVRAAAAMLLSNKGDAIVPADLIGSWLNWSFKQQGVCCDFSSPCNEHEKALAVARLIIAQDLADGC